MANETIMLAKTYKSARDLILPAVISEKLDGVPGDFYKDSGGIMRVRSRQGEELLSVDHIVDLLDPHMKPGQHVIGELIVPGKDFKDISGLVRRKHSDAETYQLVLRIYDAYTEGQENTDYMDRMLEAGNWLRDSLNERHGIIWFIPTKHVYVQEEAEAFITDIKTNFPHSEGVVIRSLEGPTSYFRAGWRSPGMLKHKWIETVDLPVHSFEEATSKEGEPLGMVGRINAIYQGQIIGVGPGKMNHETRKEVFQNQDKYTGKMIEVVYMPDPSYEALREPRFYRFRPDKD